MRAQNCSETKIDVRKKHKIVPRQNTKCEREGENCSEIKTDVRKEGEIFPEVKQPPGREEKIAHIQNLMLGREGKIFPEVKTTPGREEKIFPTSKIHTMMKRKKQGTRLKIINMIYGDRRMRESCKKCNKGKASNHNSRLIRGDYRTRTGHLNTASVAL